MVVLFFMWFQTSCGLSGGRDTKRQWKSERSGRKQAHMGEGKGAELEEKEPGFQF